MRSVSKIIAGDIGCMTFGAVVEVSGRGVSLFLHHGAREAHALPA